MKKFTVQISGEEEKALLTNMVSIQTWLDNAIHNKARQCIDAIVSQVSDNNPKKTHESKKLQIVKNAVVETAAERTAREEAKILRGI